MSLPQLPFQARPRPDDLRIPKKAVVRTIGDFGQRRLIAIGDIHGCLDELVELVEKLQLREDDILVFLGDLIDRGPKSAEVVAYVKYLCDNRPGTYCVMGNHDEKAARHRRHQIDVDAGVKHHNPMKTGAARAEEYALLDDEECLWIARLPQVIRISSARHPERLLTHAGLIEGFGTGQPTDGLIRNRYLIQKAGVWHPAPCVRGPNGEMLQPPGSVNWQEVWMGPRVIYGHAVHSLTDPLVCNNTYGIDTGCCFGGRLTAYVEHLLAGQQTEFVQVEARKVYEDQRKAVVE